MNRLFILLLLFSLFFGCTSEKKIDMSVYEKIVIKNKILTEDERFDIEEAFSDLKVTSHAISDDPSIIIYAYKNESDIKYDIYTVFLPLKLIYPGDHFVAWANKMKGRKSACFEMGDFSVELLNSYK